MNVFCAFFIIIDVLQMEDDPLCYSCLAPLALLNSKLKI